MSAKIVMFGIIVLMGVATTFLNFWLFLLNGQSRALIWAFLGIVFIVGGVLNIRRARMEIEV